MAVLYSFTHTLLFYHLMLFFYFEPDLWPTVVNNLPALMYIYCKHHCVAVQMNPICTFPACYTSVTDSSHTIHVFTLSYLPTVTTVELFICPKLNICVYSTRTLDAINLLVALYLWHEQWRYSWVESNRFQSIRFWYNTRLLKWTSISFPPAISLVCYFF